jgi:thioredoxin 1
MVTTHPNLAPVSDQDFDELVLHATQPVLVEFTAEWCPPCRVLAPSFARLSDAYEGRLHFMTIDTDENLLVPARYGVQGIPTIVLFADGKAAWRVVGPHPGRLQHIVDRLLAEANIEAPIA